MRGECVVVRLSARGLPGLAPAGEFPFFACPKKWNRKKRQPDSSPGFAGKLCCSGLAGCAQTRFAQTYAPLIRQTLRYSPSSLRRRKPNSNCQFQIPTSKIRITIHFDLQRASARVLPLFIYTAKYGCWLPFPPGGAGEGWGESGAKMKTNTSLSIATTQFDAIADGVNG